MNLGIESEKIEFKKNTNELVNGVISLSAMLNKHNEGTVYFGVENNGDVIGQKDLNENTLRDVSKRISEGIKPKVFPIVSLMLIGDRKIIKVYVNGNNVPYSAFGKYYYRSFNVDHLVSLKMLKTL